MPRRPVVHVVVLEALAVEELLEEALEVGVVRPVLEAQALPADDLLERAGSDDVSDEYAANTEEAITQGVFGVPAYALCDDLLWGQDRLDFVEALLAKEPAPS